MGEAMRLGFPKGILCEGKSRFLGVCYDDPKVTPEDKIRYDACVTVDDSVEAEGDIQIQTIETGKYATVTHFGPYENLHKHTSNYTASGCLQMAASPNTHPVSKSTKTIRKLPNPKS